MMAEPYLVWQRLLEVSTVKKYSSIALQAASERGGRRFATHCAGQSFSQVPSRGDGVLCFVLVWVVECTLNP